MKIKQLTIDGISRKKPKKGAISDPFALEALKKQSLLVLDFIRMQDSVMKSSGGEYPETILKRINGAGVEFEMSHLKASLRWLVDHSLVVKKTENRVSYYSAKEAS